MTNYAFIALTGSFQHPFVGVFSLIGGELGAGQITITNATTRTQHAVSADGNVMVSYIPGDNGDVAIEMQQTCVLHEFLLGWFNACKTAADNGDPTNWAAATLSIRNIVDGTSHQVSGISPEKIPDKTYSVGGGNVTWRLMAARVISQ